MNSNSVKGQGAQINIANKFLNQHYVDEHIEGIDESFAENPRTQVFYEHPKSIVNNVTSPDLPMKYSLNPYQGCEHGCAYCYARNSHEYWRDNGQEGHKKRRKTLTRRKHAKDSITTRFFPSGTLIAVLPPTEESIIESNVVGT